MTMTSSEAIRLAEEYLHTAIDGDRLSTEERPHYAIAGAGYATLALALQAQEGERRIVVGGSSVVSSGDRVGVIPPPADDGMVADYKRGGASHMQAEIGFRDGWNACRRAMSGE